MTEINPKQLDFTLYLQQIPSGTAQMKRTNRATGVFFEPKSVRAARFIYTSLLRGFAPRVPYEGEIVLSVRFAYATKDKKKRGKKKTTRPDCDNLVKLFIDCMTSVGFWKDDAQIVILEIEKAWSENPNASISVHLKEVR